MGEGHVVALIPARGGSKGLARKNVRPLAGKPLIAHTIQAACRAGRVERVIVSTDDQEIAEVARESGAEVPFLRPTAYKTPSGATVDLTSDAASTEEVLRHALLWLKQEEGYPVEILVYLQATDVFRHRGMIDRVVQALQEDPSLDSAFIGYRDHKNYWLEAEDGFSPMGPPRGHVSRQMKRPIYREDTGLACATRPRFLLGEPPRRLGDRVLIIPNDDPASAIDIHEEFDLWLADKVLTEWRDRDLYDVSG